MTQRRMSTSLVIEHLDVVEQRHLGFAAAREVLAELELHGGEETLHHRVVVAIAATAHAAGDAVSRQPAPVLFGKSSPYPVGQRRAELDGPTDQTVAVAGISASGKVTAP